MRLLASSTNTGGLTNILATPNDDKYLDDVETTEDIYDAVGIASFAAAIIVVAVAPYNPRSYFTAFQFSWLAYELLDASEWLRNSENLWNQLIGASGTVTVLNQIRVLTSSCQNRIWQLESDIYHYVRQGGSTSSGQYWSMMMERNTLLNNPSCWATQFEQLQVASNGQSDGFVPLAAQQLPAHVSTQGRVANLTLNGVNHNEVRNSPQLERRLRDILNGDDINLTGELRTFYITRP